MKTNEKAAPPPASFKPSSFARSAASKGTACPGCYSSEAIFSSRNRKAASSDARWRGWAADSSSRRILVRDSSRPARSLCRSNSSGVRGAEPGRDFPSSAVSFCDSIPLLSHPRAMVPVCHKRIRCARGTRCHDDADAMLGQWPQFAFQKDDGRRQNVSGLRHF